MSGYQDLSQKKSWVSVEAIAPLLGVLFILSTSSFASTGSWSQSPSWSGEESGSASRRYVRREAKQVEISPYAPGTHNIALDLGQVFLMGDLTKSYSDSLGTQLHYTYGVSDIFCFDSSIGYSEHS